MMTLKQNETGIGVYFCELHILSKLYSDCLCSKKYQELLYFKDCLGKIGYRL